MRRFLQLSTFAALLCIAQSGLAQPRLLIDLDETPRFERVVDVVAVGDQIFLVTGDQSDLLVYDIPTATTTDLGVDLPGQLVAAGDRLITNRAGLNFVSDGTTEGTREIGNFDRIEQAHAIDDTIVFVHRTRRTVDLHATPGAGNVLLLSDIEPSVHRDGDHVFAVRDDCDLWRTDGTTSGTERVAQIDSQGRKCRVYAGPPGFLVVAAPMTNGTWMVELATFTVTPRDDLDDGSDFVRIGDKVMFWRGGDLFRADTDVAQTQVVDSFGILEPDVFETLGDRIVFSRRSASLWISDGTTAGTQPVDVPGPVVNYEVFEGDFFFSLADSSIWRLYGATGAIEMMTARGSTDFSAGPNGVVFQRGEVVLVDDERTAIWPDGSRTVSSNPVSFVGLGTYGFFRAGGTVTSGGIPVNAKTYGTTGSPGQAPDFPGVATLEIIQQLSSTEALVFTTGRDLSPEGWGILDIKEPVLQGQTGIRWLDDRRIESPMIIGRKTNSVVNVDGEWWIIDSVQEIVPSAEAGIQSYADVSLIADGRILPIFRVKPYMGSNPDFGPWTTWVNADGDLQLERLDCRTFIYSFDANAIAENFVAPACTRGSEVRVGDTTVVALSVPGVANPIGLAVPGSGGFQFIYEEEIFDGPWLMDERAYAITRDGSDDEFPYRFVSTDGTTAGSQVTFTNLYIREWERFGDAVVFLARRGPPDANTPPSIFGFTPDEGLQQLTPAFGHGAYSGTDDTFAVASGRIFYAGLDERLGVEPFVVAWEPLALQSPVVAAQPGPRGKLTGATACSHATPTAAPLLLLFVALGFIRRATRRVAKSA